MLVLSDDIYVGKRQLEFRDPGDRKSFSAYCLYYLSAKEPFFLPVDSSALKTVSI